MKTDMLLEMMVEIVLDRVIMDLSMSAGEEMFGGGRCMLLMSALNFFPADIVSWVRRHYLGRVEQKIQENGRVF